MKHLLQTTLCIIVLISCNNLYTSESKLEDASYFIDAEDFEGANEILSGMDLDSTNELFEQYDSLKYIIDSVLAMTPEEFEEAKKIQAEKVKRKEAKKLGEQIDREIKSIREGVSFSNYRGTMEQLRVGLILFEGWQTVITFGNISEDEEVQHKAKKLERLVRSVQLREFPKMRKEYGKILGNTLWENDISVAVYGSRKQYITLTGGIFAANKNIKDFQTQLQESMILYRFKQANYKWYSGDDEYTYFTIESKKDSE